MLQGGSGTPVLLLHGAGGSRSLLPLAESLALDHEVLVPDHPAFGETDECAWITGMSDLAYFYLDVLDALDLREAHVIGHSMGGWLACEIAVRSTHRIKSLTLIASVGIYLKGAPFGDLFLWNPEELTRNLFATEAALATALAYQPTEREVEIMVKNRVGAARYGWSPRLHNPDLAKWLHRIDVPSLILWGADDKIVPVAYAQEFQRLIPNAQATVFQKCGHIPQIDQSKACALRLTRFLGGLPA